MANLLDLPFELIYNIFIELDQNDKLNFILVNTLIYQYCITNVYKVVSLDSLNSFEDVDWVHYGKYIQQINILQFNKPINQYISFFALLDELFSNQSIELNLLNGCDFNINLLTAFLPFKLKQFYIKEDYLTIESAEADFLSGLKLLKAINKLKISAFNLNIKKAFLDSINFNLKMLNYQSSPFKNKSSILELFPAFEKLVCLELILIDETKGLKELLYRPHLSLKLLKVSLTVSEQSNKLEVICLKASNFCSLKTLEWNNEAHKLTFSRTFLNLKTLKLNLIHENLELLNLYQLPKLNKLVIHSQKREGISQLALEIETELNYLKVNNLKLNQLHQIDLNNIIITKSLLYFLHSLCPYLTLLELHSCSLIQSHLQTDLKFPLSIKTLKITASNDSYPMIRWLVNNSPELKTIHLWSHS